MGIIGLLAAIRSSLAPAYNKSPGIKIKLPISRSPDRKPMLSEDIIKALPATSLKPSIITGRTDKTLSRENDTRIINQEKLTKKPPSQLGTEVSPISSNNRNTATTIPNANSITPGKSATQASMAAKLNNFDWRSYGRLQVDRGNLRPLDGGNIVAPAVDEKGTQFYIAINCRRHILNNTGPKLEWGSWYSPQKNHEQLLIRDICKK